MSYTYDEAVDMIVTQKEARAEVKRHGGDWEDFVADVGDKPTYTGEEVLAWLGY
jgi:hypothetical protein